MLGDLTPEEEFQIEVDRSSEKLAKHGKVKLVHFADDLFDIEVDCSACSSACVIIELLRIDIIW